MKNFIIKIENSKELGEIIQRFLFRNGYTWACGSKEKIVCTTNSYYIGGFNSILYYEADIDHVECHLPKLNMNYFSLDTQLGEFIKYIEKEEFPPPPKDIEFSLGATLVKLMTNGNIECHGHLTKNNLEYCLEKRKELLDHFAAWEHKYGKKD